MMKKNIISALLLCLFSLSAWAQQIYEDQNVMIDKIEKGSYKISYKDGPNFSSMFVIEGDKQAMVVDAGDKDVDLVSLIRKCTDKPYFLVLTHTHGDHLGAVNQFPELYVNSKESMNQLKQMYKGEIKYMTDGQVFDLGGKTIQALEIVGHTAGGMIFCDYETGNCYSGDCFGTGQVWLQFGSFPNPITVYANEMKKMLGYMGSRHITHIYTGHFGQEDCVYGINYIQDMCTLAQNMLKGDYTAVHHNRSAETSPIQMTSLRRAVIVFHPDRVK